MVDIDEIYSTKVLEFAANMPLAGRLSAPDATASAHSKLCGSRITVDLTVTGGVITGYAQDVRACLLGQAAAAIVGAHIIGTSSAEFHDLAAKMRRMLKDNGRAPDGRWADLGILESVRDYKARHASTLLVFDAVEMALGQVEERQKSEAESH